MSYFVDCKQDERIQAVRQFEALLREFDIFVTHKEEPAIKTNMQISCRLQAPTIADTAGRLIKGGWMPAGGHEGLNALCLKSPDGDIIRITRHKTFTELVYQPVITAGAPVSLVWPEGTKDLPRAEVSASVYAVCGRQSVAAGKE